MSAAKDRPVSQPATDQYRYNWSKIFENKEGAEKSASNHLKDSEHDDMDNRSSGSVSPYQQK